MSLFLAACRFSAASYTGVSPAVTYHRSSVLGLLLLAPNHLLDAAVLGSLSLPLPRDCHGGPSRLLLEPLGLGRLLHRCELSRLTSCILTLLPCSRVGRSPLRFFVLPSLTFSGPPCVVLLVALPHLEDLLGLALGLLDLLPGLLLFHLEQGDAVREQLCIVRRLLLVHTSILQSPANFLSIIVVVLLLAILAVLVLLLFLWTVVLLVVLLHLRNGLHLLRRVCLVVLHFHRIVTVFVGQL